MFNTFVSSVLAPFVVAVLSYLNDVLRVMKVVSGSMIAGLTEATAYCLRLVTILAFVDSVKVVPDFALIEIKTLPYSGVAASSPP